MGRLRNYFLNHYPRTDFHELNQDWMISMLYDMINQVENFVEMNSVKYADPIQWDITRQYEKNTIVVDSLTGTAYISSKPVPIGVALSRTEYWDVIFDLGRFITLASQNFANSYEAVLTTTATMPTDENGWLVWNSILYRAKNDIHVGDRYVVDGNIEKYTVEMFFDELAHLISEETEARIEGDNTLHGEIVDESVARENADTALQDNIDAEATARESTDDTLQDNIDAEATARENADDTLQDNIDAEATARENTDTVLDGRIDDIIDGTTPFTALNAPNALKFNTPTSHSRYFNYLPYTDPDGNTVNILTGTADTDKVVNSMYVNVLGYGADLTGVNDSTTAIQDAIDYAASLPNGGIVYLPAGTYKITNTLRLKSKVSMLGDGMIATFLNCQFSANNVEVAIDAHSMYIGGCFIKGMKIWRDIQSVSQGVYPLWLRQAGILFGCTVEEYNQAIFKIEDVSIRNFVCGISGGYFHGTQSAIGLFDSVLDNVWCVDCSACGIALGGSGNQIRHPRIVSCGTGIMFIRISSESFDGDLIVGGIFIANLGYDFTFRDAGLYRPIRFIDTWFEQSGAGIINVPFANTRVTTFGMEGCLMNSNTTIYDTFTCGNINAGIIELRNCCMYLTVAGGNNNIHFPTTTTTCKGVAVNCTKVDRDGTFMIYEKLT